MTRPSDRGALRVEPCEGRDVGSSDFYVVPKHANDVVPKHANEVVKG